MLRLRRCATLFVSGLLILNSAQAQEISDELNSLEDFPEDDLSGESPSPTPETAPPAPEMGDELSLDDAPPSDTPAEGLDDFAGEEVPPDAPAEPPADESQLSDLDKLDAQESEPPAESAPSEPAETAAQSLTGVEAEAASALTALNFRQLTDRVRIILATTRPADYGRELRTKRRQILIELRNTQIANKLLKRTLDTGEFDGPVALVQAFPSKVGSVDSVKVLIQLRRMSDPKITRQKNELLIDFALGQNEKRVFKDQAKQKIQLPETFLGINEGTRYFGSRISLNAKDADLPDIIQTISKVANRNFTLDPSATGKKVTLNVKEVPWDQVLALVLQNNDLGYQRVGNVYRIVPTAKLKTEIDEAVKAAKANQVLTPQETRIFPINYATAQEVSTNVQDLLTKGENKGTSSIEARTNSLVVTDTPDILNKIAEYIASVDRQTAMIQIEGRIVEASEIFSKSLGIQWKLGEFNGGALAGSYVNLGSAGQTLETAPSYSQLAGTGDRGGARLRIGNLGSIGSIQALLSMAETRNEIKVVASPRVTVLDTKQANITAGQTRTLTTPASGDAGSSTTSISANLSLQVTPRVTSDGFVNMKVSLKKSDFGGADSTSTSDRSTDTELLIESGKTAVIGGVYSVRNEKDEKGWPLLNRLPILGTLFKDSTSRSNNVSELLMFISPKILNADRAFLSYKEGLHLKESENEDELDADLSTLDLKELEAPPASTPKEEGGEELTL